MKNKTICIIVIILCVIIPIVGIIGINHYNQQQEIKAKEREKEQYNQALECIKNEEWEQAKDLLKDVSWEVCHLSLRNYVDARLQYDPEDMRAVKDCKRLLSYMVKTDIEDFEDEIISFIKEVNDQYGVLRRQELKGTFPYVGMNAADLYYTELGEPYMVTEDVLIARTYRHYYYKYNGYKYVIVVSSPADEKDKEENKRVIDITKLNS